MSIPIGNKAQGEDFFDREREREELWRYLEGNHILVCSVSRKDQGSVIKGIDGEYLGSRHILKPRACT